MSRITRFLLAAGILALPALALPAVAKADNFSLSFSTPGAATYYSNYGGYGYGGGYRPPVVYNAAPPVVYYGAPTYYYPPRQQVVYYRGDRAWDRGWQGRPDWRRGHHWDRGPRNWDGPHRGNWHR